MKQKDLTFLVASILVSIFLSVLVAKFFFSTSKNLNQTVDVVPVISTNFPVPSSQYFNNQAIDPTQTINIGPNNNQNLFNQSTN